jgi:hypothetical protein
MAELWGKLDRVLGKLALDREDPTALGLLRIVVVSLLTLSLLTHVGSIADYFSNQSVLAGEFAREAFPSRWSLFFYVENATAVRAIYAVGLVAHLCWIVGYRTRIASILAWILWVSMFGRHPLLYSLADELQIVLCTLLMLMPTGRGLSVDARQGRGGSVPVWCRRVIQLQIAVVYTATGMLKEGVTWRDEGTALYYALSNPYNRHFEMPGLLASIQPWILRPATYTVLVWEIAFGPFVAMHWLRGLLGRPKRFPDLRWLFLGFGALMHIGIQAMLYVAWFSPLSMSTYLAFLRPEEAKRLLERATRRLLGARP